MNSALFEESNLNQNKLNAPAMASTEVIEKFNKIGCLCVVCIGILFLLVLHMVD